VDLIATHDSADFDALASLFAAKKLYPSAICTLSTHVSGSVRDFLAIHKDRFATTPARDVDQARVSRFIIVDVRRASRLSSFAPLVERARKGELEVHVYDHHAASEDDVPATLEVVERTGSATTLLVERIAAQGISLDPVEATLFSLGVHVDTGSLSYAGSTARDARAIAWLMDQGASLAMLNRYLHAPLAPKHRDLLRAVLGKSEAIRIGAEDVALCDASFAGAQDGLDLVASEIAALEGHRALFLWTTLPRGRIHVVARGCEGGLDVGRVLRSLGGGGHRTAASAMVKQASSAEVREKIVAAIEAEPPRALRVADVMTSPAHVAPSTTPLGALKDSLATWHASGVPIVDECALVGIVSARDLAGLDPSVLRHPAKSRMRRDVVTIGPDEPLESALEAMTRADVGRLPVMRAGRVIGIITRSDVRRALYGLP